MSDVSCRACGNAEGNSPLTVREMMYGRRDPIDYVQCSRCGSLSLVTIPANLDDYYPADYYSFDSSIAGAPTGWQGAARRIRSDAMLRSSHRVAELAFRAGRIPKFGWWLSGLGLSTRSAILDIGSGRGTLLSAMCAEGFVQLSGADPYLADSETLSNGVRLIKSPIEDLDGHYDLIMMNHTFEHVPDASLALRQVRRLLRPGGSVLIRVPVADSHAFEVYGPDWVQIDAPRHILIPTELGMSALAGQASMRVLRSFRDSSAFQFWGSEQYRRDIPLRSPSSYAENRAACSPTLIREWKDHASLLNRQGRGDSAGFLMRPADRTPG